ncbi:hypothetical protein BIY23_00715 [Wolbachia pipientis]|uniref:PQ-loop repeat-containing protein n=1 Tax=Wolbachia pipientis TaxID=955 RepID=A0A1E7QL78_WOLPI|nr:PQ-loop repeat-containing protein [Wolbachia pipientis]OEY87193.1 hypothetical protein BIY23_00715 [Wolbachia pipientis]
MLSIGEFFGYIALATSLVGLLPQIYKAYITKSTSAISMLMLVNGIVCSSSWIVYSVYQHSMFVMCSSIVGLIANIVLVIQKLYYDDA